MIRQNIFEITEKTVEKCWYLKKKKYTLCYITMYFKITAITYKKIFNDVVLMNS